MTEPAPSNLGSFPSRTPPAPYGQGTSANLADILERVLDKGIVIAGDVQDHQARFGDVLFVDALRWPGDCSDE
ncbi:hypothetical protein AR457_34940 [Streptomyces agglomeratus]|uniref:Uncharacterized protein n=1 Tax=Streptomyces agglomeratus TaxID=285458 RepID=A0A1E5PGQ8_9ACTN|nr:hypothetical protein AS594_34110 [Streptomyces agglomeratus]OEJ37189.1 hypothetical protein BGK70_02440 [Streptomyces agglomeratus]OEJ48542.1 hypothetical protein AR457_34940 [Streptomyces agglomeratus]OEJ49743.1 hypothetical protein BGK72_01975 [Streptomyces agglomeratus]OEJ57049.1 hypothetical protein BGM19_02540 [Streptomyces agglomeratus]